MNSGKIVAGRVDGWTDGRKEKSKVLQEVLVDLKRKHQFELFSKVILLETKLSLTAGGGGIRN